MIFEVIIIYTHGPWLTPEAQIQTIYVFKDKNEFLLMYNISWKELGLCLWAHVCVFRYHRPPKQIQDEYGQNKEAQFPRMLLFWVILPVGIMALILNNTTLGSFYRNSKTSKKTTFST